MRSRSLISRVFIVALIFTLILPLCACGLKGNPVTVTIYDGANAVTAEGSDAMTVRDLIRAAGIKVGPKDQIEPDLDKIWSEAGADRITVKRCVKVTVTDGKVTGTAELVGGTVEQAIAQAGFNTAEYSSDIDKSAPLTDGMKITLTRYSDGFVRDGSKAYLYRNGEPVTNAVVDGDDGQKYYADAAGVIDLGYCDGVNVNGSDWIVINGVATPVVTDSDGALFNACKAVAGFTDSSMTKEEKLRACFDHIRTDYFEGVRRDDYKGMDWPVLYSNDLLVYGKGDCFSFGAAFAYMARAIGYTETYACNSGGHGWAEVDGLVYDPEWSMHHKDEGGSYFGVDYENNDTEVNYKRGIAPGEPWMRVKV